MRRGILIVALAVLAGPLALGGVGETREEYRKKASETAEDDALAQYRLGLWCRQSGLDEEARLQFERVVALEPDHEGARRALGHLRHEGRWLEHEEAMRAKGLVKHEGRWLLPEEVRIRLLPESELERKRAGEAKTRKFLKKMASGDPKVHRIAAQALSGVRDEHKVEPLAYGLRYPAENVRVFAAKELARIGDRRALKPLIHRSLVDPSATVRETALSAVKSFDDPNLLAPYVKAMWSEDQPIRINAAKAVGEMGDVTGIEYLVYRLRAHGGGLTRSHIYLAQQLSFIQDFDVEVAQTAFIADPIVGVLQEGRVLDVRVLATERVADLVERRVIRSSLKKLAGVDKGDDPAAWAAWWKENKKNLVKAD